MVIDVDSFNSQPIQSGLPTIKVIGVGGGGGNVVNRMINDGVKGVQYIAANTDMMVLNSSKADIVLPLGTKTTKGLGAGMRPDVGRLAAEEAIDAIRAALENTDMVFIAAGMGGGTGTGAAPIVAEIAKEMKILTVGVVTTPFRFEGSKRNKIAMEGIADLKKHVDTLMIIPNDKLLEIASSKTTMNEAFSIADDVLKQAISGITNLINLEGFINLDFADLKTVMADKGRAIMGTGVSNGENRGLEAAKKAISSPLLSDTPISGATGVIINIVADEQFSLLDAQAAAEFIQSNADQDADVIFGVVTEASRENEVVITVIATGFDSHLVEKDDRGTERRPLRVVDSLRNKITATAKDEYDAEDRDEDADKIIELGPELIDM
jgi:cell division protein FtsZ